MFLCLICQLRPTGYPKYSTGYFEGEFHTLLFLLPNRISNPFFLWHLLKLSSCLIVRNGLTYDSPIFRRYNMRFDYEIYAFGFFNVSHLLSILLKI
jgi:hypothetical protein